MSSSAANRWLRLLAALVLGATAVSQAADSPTAIPADNTDNSGVFVRDSAIALERIALAQRMERLKEWGKSADLYQEILTKYPDRVVAVPPADGGRVVQYTSVTEAVSRALCKWPPEGLDVYRSRYERVAAGLLEKAGTQNSSANLDALHQVYWNYFPTDSGKLAGIRLMDAYFELGDDAAVAQIGRRLLDWHPNLVAERPMTLYQTALSEKLCGDTGYAQKHAQELRQRFPQAVGAIRGADTVLADSLGQEMARTTGPVVAANDSWLTLGGDETRDKISDSTIKPGARLYSIQLSELSPKQSNDQNRAQAAADAAERIGGAAIGVMPVVDRGEMFFQDNARLYGVNIDTGRPLPGWDQTWHGQNGCYQLAGGIEPVPPGQQFCVTLSDKCVVAVMGLPSGAIGFPVLDSQPQSRLVCVDRENGKEIWTTSVAQLPDNQSALRHLQLGGAPLIVGDNVYVLGTGGQGQAFKDCYVLCFALADGQFRWASYIASANSASGYFPNSGPLDSATAVSHLAYASGRVFALTNLGAVAALDAYSGSVAWLNIYRDRPVTSNQGPILPGMMGGGNPEPIAPPAPWTFNPTIVHNGKIFILPTDSPYILVYDADNGAELKRIWLDDLPPGDGDPNKPDTLVSVNGDIMYLAGPSRVWRLPWQKYDHDNDHQPSGYWASVSTGSNSGMVRGHAFVTADALYLPMAAAMQRVLLKNGMIDPKDGTFPRNGWEEGKEQPGNVLVTDDYVVVAGDQYVSVYTDLDVARQKLDSEIAAAPNEPLPRLHYAEVMFAAGQNGEAEDKFRQVFQLLGGPHDLSSGVLHDRAFDDVLNFATRLSQKQEQKAAANRLFDMAQAAALTPEQQVAYRIARAKFAIATSDLPAALELYQEILADDVLRQSPLNDPETATSSHAGKVAEHSIQKVLGLVGGPAAYDKFQHAAADALAAAKLEGNPAKLLAVANMYPNAPQASQAMLAAADVYELGDNPRQATLVLRQLLSKCSAADRATVLESMARNYLKIPGRIEVAATRLSQAASATPGAMLSKPLTLPDGTVLRDMTLSQSCDRLRKYVAQAVADALPDLHLPTGEQCAANHLERNPFLPESSQQVIKNVDALVIPMTGFARNDRVIAWSASAGLMAYPVGKNTPSFTCSTIKDPPRDVAWMDASLLVWTNTGIFLIDPDSGKIRAQIDITSLPDLPVMANPTLPERIRPVGATENEQITNAMPVGDRVMFATTIGRIFSIDSSDGHIVWQSRVGAHSMNGLLASDDFTVIEYDDAQICQLIVLNSFTGDLIGRKSFSRDSGIYPLNIALGDDGTLAYTLPDQLCLQDLYEANNDEGGMEPKLSATVQTENQQPFVGASGPNRMILHGDRAFALTEQGRNVCVFSLENGQLWKMPSGDPAVLPSKSDGSPDVQVYLSGHYLYLLSPRHLSAYEVEDPARAWDSPAPQQQNDFVEVLFGKDYLLAVDQRQPRPVDHKPHGLTLFGYSRAPVKSRPEAESGICRYEFSLDPESTEWQPVEGGIVYFSGNQIHTLLGARDSLSAGPTP